MHFSILALTTALVATTNAAAITAPPPAPSPSGDPTMRNCDTRFRYCGSDLMSISHNYKKQIDKALAQAGQPIDDSHEQESLFDCIDGVTGDVFFKVYCPSLGEGAYCVNAGHNENDYCYVPGPFSS